MRPYGTDLRWKSLVTLFALSSATLSTVSAGAQIAEPLTTLPASPSTATPASPPVNGTAPATAAASPRPRPQPIELREIFWGGRYGELRHGPVPFQGGKVLEGADFYRALNREDLARAYESRLAGRVAVVSAGFLAGIVGGIVLASTGLPDTHCSLVSMPYPFSPPQQVCTTDSHDTAIGIGVGLLILGPLVAMGGGLGLAPDPVSPAERQRLIDTYNASLGTPTAETAPARPRRAAFSLGVEPTVSATGAGLTLGGRF